MNKIAIFASGSGSNAENIVNYFKRSDFEVDFLFLTNNPDAYIITRAKALDVEIEVFTRSEFYEEDVVQCRLIDFGCDFIVLAGFLWLIPSGLINKYKGRMVNIHPALLPHYGGKGMYGRKIHEAVVANKEVETGISIHYVDENYDEGAMIAQYHCEVKEDDSPSDVEKKVHELEYKYYPMIIEKLLKEKAL